LLTRVLGMRQARQYRDPLNPEIQVHVYEMGAGGPTAELHVAVRPACRARVWGPEGCITLPSGHPPKNSITPGPND
jgi:hypothetical protein